MGTPFDYCYPGGIFERRKSIVIKIIHAMNSGKCYTVDHGTLVSLLRIRIHPQDVVALLTSLGLGLDPLGKAKIPLDNLPILN